MPPVIRQDVIDYLAALDSDEYESLTAEARQTGSVGQMLSDALSNTGVPTEASILDPATSLTRADDLANALFGKVGATAPSGDLSDFL